MPENLYKAQLQDLTLLKTQHMSFVFPALRANTRRLIPSGRSFRTPFAVLGSSPTTPSPTTIASHYEKQYDHPPEPINSRTYVVSEPDASTKHYQVPAGAYPTSAPYTHFTADEHHTKRESTGGEQQQQHTTRVGVEGECT